MPGVMRFRLGAACSALVLGSLVLPAEAASLADLQVTATKTLVYSQVPGSELQVKATVANVGAVKAKATYTRMFLSRDGVKSPDDFRFAKVATPRLLPATSTKVTLTGTLPDPLASGTWKLIVCADSSNLVPESSELNCRRWMKFTHEPAPPGDEGPNGGAVSVCSGALTRTPYGNGSYAAPLGGVHLTASPASGGVVPYTGLPVGVEPAGDETDPFQVVTITNDGTTNLSGISEWNAGVCQYDNTKSDFWGVIDRGTIDDEMGITTPCGSTLGAGASCELAIVPNGPTERGGSDLPGWIRIGVQTGAAHDYIAYFPVGASSASQGYWLIQGFDGGGRNVNNGQHQTTFLKLTNVGDMHAVPSLTIDGAGGWTRQPAASWDLSEPNPDTAGEQKCGDVTLDPGPPPVYSPGLPPGSSCLIKLDFCSDTNGTRVSTLTAHPGGAPRAFDPTLDLTREVAGAGPAC